MASKTYQINMRNIALALFKVVFVFIAAQFLLYIWHKEFYIPMITYGDKKILPVHFVILCVCLFTTAQIIKIIKNCIWDYYLPKRKNIRLSSLLIGIINFSIYLVAIFLCCHVIFELDVNSALAATGAVGVVLGFGLQKIFSDLFVGISIDMDKSFRMNEWISLKSDGAIIYGEIIQMNWRVVSVKTVENLVHHIPNSIFGQQIVTNLSSPTPESEFELLYTIPYQFNENTVIKTILRGLEAVTCIGIISDYKCQVTNTSIYGIIYKVKYFVNPEKYGPGKARHFVHSRVFRFLRAAGISISTTDQRNFLIQTKLPVLEPGHEIAGYISKIDLFQTLTERQINDIAAATTERNFNKGDVICQQGDEGRSLFIVRDGCLKVFIMNDAGAQQQVAVLIPEDFFGEMSLLTGDKRSATVIAESQVILYEIEAGALASLFASNEKFPQILSKIITERNATNSALAKTPEEEVAQVSKLKELEARIKNFSKKLLGIKG